MKREIEKFEFSMADKEPQTPKVPEGTVADIDQDCKLTRRWEITLCFELKTNQQRSTAIDGNGRQRWIEKDKEGLHEKTPNFDSAAARRYGNNFRLLKDKTHVSLFSEDSLIRFLRDNKFKIFKIEYPFFETPFFNKKNLLKILTKKQVSPPFYGSVITLFCKKC